MTFDNQTFASLGVTPGTYEWTWGTGPNQNFTVNIVAAAVSEPASVLLLGGRSPRCCLCAHAAVLGTTG